MISRERCAPSAHYQFPNDSALREWGHRHKDGEYHPRMLDETTANSGSCASDRANIWLRKSCQKLIERTDHPRKMSQEKALKGIQRSDRFIARESAGGAGASIRIEKPSGQLAESAQIPMTQIREGVSLSGSRGDHENLRMKRWSRLWT
jgi:hypothetical protein